MYSNNLLAPGEAVHYSRFKTERSKTVFDRLFLTETVLDPPSLYS